MNTREIIKKIRKIEIRTSRMVTDVFAGQYKSVFKGRGMEFDEVREYMPGDEIRTIDWNVTARTGIPHVKKFVEERQLTVMLLLDASMSCRFGSGKQLKIDYAAEICSVLALSAIKNDDRVGLMVFTDRVEKFIPPRKGLQHVLRVIREALYFKPQGKTTDIRAALEFFGRVMKRRTIAFLLSDYFDSGYKEALSIANRRHDVVAVTISDPRETTCPGVGVIDFVDAETGARKVVDTSSRSFRRRYETSAKKRASDLKKLLRSAQVDMISVETDTPYEKELIKFFKMREKRFV